MENILVIGSINMDLVIKTPVIPKMGETVNGYDFATISGGKGANQAVACGKLNGNVKMIGCVGRDVYGDLSIENLSNNNVDVSCIEKVDASTGVAVITVCNGDNCIILDHGANSFVDNSLIEKHIDVLKWADIIIMQFEIPLDTVIAVAKYAKKFGARLVLNPAPMVDFDIQLLKYVDIFVPNQFEAGIILNTDILSIDDAKIAVNKLVEMGAQTVIITLGEDGCVYNIGNEIFRKSAYNVTPVDATAAGDSFIGGFCVALSTGKTLTQAIDYATAVAAITVTRYGASISIPNSEEVSKYLSIN